MAEGQKSRGSERMRWGGLGRMGRRARRSETKEKIRTGTTRVDYDAMSRLVCGERTQQRPGTKKTRPELRTRTAIACGERPSPSRCMCEGPTLCCCSLVYRIQLQEATKNCKKTATREHNTEENSQQTEPKEKRDPDSPAERCQRRRDAAQTRSHARPTLPLTSRDKTARPSCRTLTDRPSRDCKGFPSPAWQYLESWYSLRTTG